MPRPRNRVAESTRDIARLEKKLKVYRQWIAAEREALEFRDFIRARRAERRRWARDRQIARELARRDARRREQGL